MHMCEHICGGIEMYGKYMNRCRCWGEVLSYSLHQLNSELDKKASLDILLVLEIHFHLPSSGIICELPRPSDISEGPGEIQILVLMLAWLRIQPLNKKVVCIM